MLNSFRFGDFSRHDWYASTSSQLSLVTSLIVWGAIPFVTISVYAGLAQVPRELVEAAEVDGAGSLRVFRDVTFPILKPILLILTSLSIIWDFAVFTQPYLLLGQAQLNVDNYLMAIYLFEEGYFQSDFGRGAAISPLDAGDRRCAKRLLCPEDGAGRRRRVSSAAGTSRGRRRRRLRKTAWNIVGLALLVVLVFPVYWMISTAFKPDDEIVGLHTDVALPDAPRSITSATR